MESSPSSSTSSPIFPLELPPDFREIVFRIQEMRFAFGRNDVDHFCTQVKDYVDVLFDREKNRLEYRGTSKFRRYRTNVIRYMMKLAELEGYTRATLHLAIYIYDRFADFHNIPLNQVYTVVLACIIIAGKIEERDLKTPKIKKLSRYLNPSCDTFCFVRYKDLEFGILKYLNWAVIIPTSYTFMEFYLLFALDVTDTLSTSPPPTDTELLMQMDLNNNNNGCKVLKTEELQDVGYSSRNVNTIRSLALEVLDTLLYDEPDDRFPPSLIAAGSLMFSRKMYGFHGWSDQMVFATGYPKPIVLHCCHELIEKSYQTHLHITN